MHYFHFFEWWLFPAVEIVLPCKKQWAWECDRRTRSIGRCTFVSLVFILSWQKTHNTASFIIKTKPFFCSSLSSLQPLHPSTALIGFYHYQPQQVFSCWYKASRCFKFHHLNLAIKDNKDNLILIIVESCARALWHCDCLFQLIFGIFSVKGLLELKGVFHSAYSCGGPPKATVAFDMSLFWSPKPVFRYHAIYSLHSHKASCSSVGAGVGKTLVPFKRN